MFHKSSPTRIVVFKAIKAQLLYIYVMHWLIRGHSKLNDTYIAFLLVYRQESI